MRRALAWLSAVSPILVLMACEAAPPPTTPQRPSILLVVIDTLRRDAVSTYGAVEGTTPNLDALAAESLVFDRAYSSSSWTLPSHATLLTALPIEAHRVGMPGRVVLPEDVTTIAERLRDAGYETAAFAENLLLSEATGMLRGFDHRVAHELRRVERGEKISVQTIVDIDVVAEIRSWLESRERDRPFFVFVNLYDPHSEYEIHDENPFVPSDIPRSEIERRPKTPEWQICSNLPSDEQLTVLHGLYLGDVERADAKLGGILELMRDDSVGPLITVVTADHGEFFGERRLMGHEFSLGSAVLDVPLVVNGLEGTTPGHIGTPVTLQDVGESILHWSGADGRDVGGGRPLPRTPDAAPGEREFFSAYSDRYVVNFEDWKGVVVQHGKDGMRRGCLKTEPVWGEVATLIRYPYKLHWRPGFPPELYDLSWDPNEQSNVAGQEPELVADMTREIESIVESHQLLDEDRDDVEPPSEEVLRALKELGYIE